MLLENGADADVEDSGYTPLFNAIWIDDKEMVGALVSGGADINKRPKDDDPPLFYAVWQCHAVVKILIDAGADVNAEGVGNGWTPLHHAVQSANADVARQFIGTGVNIPAFQNAVLEGDLAKVRQIVESGTDVDTKDKFGWTPAYWALSAGRKEIAEYLLSKGADVRAKTNDGCTLLHQASKAGFVEITRQLIAKGADVSAATAETGRQPLADAAGYGHEEIVKLLVAKGADVNAMFNKGRHALGNAALAGHEDVVKLLLASGAEVNLHSESRGTALHAAAQSGHDTILDILIANGADVNLNAIRGTPLHRAAYGLAKVKDGTSAEIVEKLLAKGADVNAKDPRQGRTALHVAANRGRYRTAEVLIAAGANVNAADNEGKTPLSLAQESGHTEIVELLRKHGAKDDTATAGDKNKAVQSLHQTVMYGDVEQVKALIADGAHVNAKDKLGATPLHRAAEKGSAVIVELLIAKGADVNAKCRLDRTPLQQAAFKGHKDVVQILLDSGAKINTKSLHGLTPLHSAIFWDHTEVARMLIRRGADVNARAERDIATPMDIAVRKGFHDMVELLIESGADIPFPDIHFTAFQGDVSKVKDLIQRGANVDEEDRRGKTPLFFAVCGGQRETMEFLLSNAANIDAKDVDGTTPLHYTAYCGNLKMTGLLLAKGADIDVRDKWGTTPLHGAAEEGRKETASLLIKKGADVNAKNKEGRTPLHEAVEWGGKEVVALLIAAGADVNAENEGGYTPLYLATVEPDEDIIDLLKSKGATLTETIHLAADTGDFAGVKRYIEEGTDINKGDKSGSTPLLLAVFCGQGGGQEEVVKFLLANGADVNASRNDGWTPLHMACLIGRKDMVELLIAKGADVNAKSDDGRTPTDFAKRFHYSEIIDLLRKHEAKGDPSAESIDAPSAKSLQQAATDGDLEQVKKLISEGADVSAATAKTGRQPLADATSTEAYLKLTDEMRNIVDRNQKNFDSMRWIHGTIKLISTKSFYHGKGSRVAEEIVEFWYDGTHSRTDLLESKLIGKETDPLLLKHESTGGTAHISPRAIGYTEIKSIESKMKYLPSIPRIFIIPQKEEARRNIKPPFQFVYYQTVEGDTLKEDALRLAKLDQYFTVKNETADGDDCLLLENYNVEYDVTTKFWVVPSKGYCIKKMQLVQKGIVRKGYTTTLKEYLPGIWWFDSVKAIRLGGPEGINPDKNVELSVKSLTLNEPIEPKTFTLAGTNIPHGTEVQDDISGLRYVYGAEE